ncbi:hypothetical protein MPTK1_1g08000 [Marchantia polymorpha subsp. ruderalis]|uniref:DUF7755 domain-containing protein n=2 Tax=Marchantia polymorpha TaxID=3197 RepID=A0AAF6AMS8_MARPO|nr:hypothetical protein MARPO_0036s0044 [Marchantia polymorpha]BBM97748.1 hypothetical protein Mp_1g08000 [Marchantia polymorpha subsp. ruderalis]|eukprot:PTQ41051.1 hypothetical protein MARPO_0036s0044 [Marchantia polymorpha]
MAATHSCATSSWGRCARSDRLPERNPNSRVRDGSLLLLEGRSPRRIPRSLHSARATLEPPSRVQDTSRQTFVNPSWLFPSRDGDGAEDGASTSGRSAAKEAGAGEFDALYFLTIRTSQEDNSDLTEPSAGIQLAMIGQGGQSLLRTVPPVAASSPSRFRTARFQAGASDDDVFQGPDVGRLAALWIAPERGTWRLAQARVIVVQWVREFDGRIDRGSVKDDLSAMLTAMAEALQESGGSRKWRGLVHLFDSNEKLIGSEDDTRAAELKPSLVREYSDPISMREALLGSSIKSGKIPSSYLPAEEVERLRELSMKEYEDLKLQFLGITLLLVGVGTASFAALGQDRLTESFAAGGLGGFLYLLSLQKFVDQLPGPGNSSTAAPQADEGASSTLGAARLPLSVALVAGIALLVGRISQGGAVASITPQMLVAGVGGFLTSRVAVILASLRAKPSEDK